MALPWQDAVPCQCYGGTMKTHNTAMKAHGSAMPTAMETSSAGVVYFVLHPIYFPRITLALPLSSNSDPGHLAPLPPPSPLRYVPSFLSPE